MLRRPGYSDGGCAGVALKPSTTLQGAFIRQKVIVRSDVDGKHYRANRLAWLYMTGKWPKLEIGYINRNISDTRWANLRAMTPSQRGATSRRRNKHGVRGIWITKSGKYVARIKVAGKTKYLGSFDTIEKASVAYTRAAKDSFGQFARAR